MISWNKTAIQQSEIFNTLRNMIKVLAFIMLFALTVQAVHGVILYSGDNSVNQTAPDNERINIFNAVAKVSNADGAGSYGSAIYVKGKYLLTANHVANRSHITFDGTALSARDTAFTPRRIGNTDMKLIKLVEDPELPTIELNIDPSADLGVMGTLIGWGVGRDPSVSDTGTGLLNVWAWGAASTFAKRWGTNRVLPQAITLQSTFNGVNYTYEGLSTNLDATFPPDDNEAAAAIYDSGSGLFANIAGTWKLIGLTTLVSKTNTSTFAAFDGDRNFFVRISTYASDIEAAIPDTSNYSGWLEDHGLDGLEAENTTDTDGDGIGQLLEFALGGDPIQNDISILPAHRLIKENNETYLEMTLTRPKGLQGIRYIPQTTTDPTNWPNDSTGIIDSAPPPFDNGDGTETLTYRCSQAVSANDRAFIRIAISESL